MKNIIYTLNCPITGEVHYVGRSTNGLIRPTTHLRKSHSKKIQEWVEDLSMLGHRPDIKIVEELPEVLGIAARERFWVNKYLNKGCNLLNCNLVTAAAIHKDLNSVDIDSHSFEAVGEFVRIARKQSGLTQVELSEKSGVALSTLRKIEKGKVDINVRGLMTILLMFGATLQPTRIKELKQ
tara:strand:- start:3256 stop:3798 length:543 start_codon:yes stop_codon:yes gene_type:complete